VEKAPRSPHGVLVEACGQGQYRDALTAFD
jgi:hypothetical protein